MLLRIFLLFNEKQKKLTLPQFPKEGILFSKENNVSQTQVHTQSNTVSKSFLWKNANWRDLANPGKVLFRSLKRREGLCKAILCSGKSNLEGRKAAIMAIFKEKKDFKQCILEIFDNISNVNYWQKEKSHLFGNSFTVVPRKAASLEHFHKLSSVMQQRLHKSEMISSGTAVKCYSNNTSLTFE